MNLAFLKSHKTLRLAILVPIALSSFTHLWNPTGFPDLFFDEGIYMRRAMNVIENGSPQEAYFHYFYDHPFFGQLFLAGALGVVGYPDSLNPDTDAQSMESLYLVPRILMGLLAVADTFLIYKISQKRYNSKVAIIASILFAVMPITWFVRRILLDSILLPFFLTSILFAVYLKDSEDSRCRSYTLIILSGAFLGLAIFTKLPIVTMIPFIGYLVYSNSGKKVSRIGLWLIPVILIPLIWPLESAAGGRFDVWVSDIFWQVNRDSDRITQVLEPFFIIDPVLLVMGSAGIAYATIKKYVFILLWLIPFLLFLSFVGYAQYFHIIPIVPAFCIASALLISGLAGRIRNAKKEDMIRIGIVTPLALFGLVSTTLLITTDMTSAQFEAAAFALTVTNEDTSIIANPIYSWMYIHIFDIDNKFRDYFDVVLYPIETERIVVISDNHFKNDIKSSEKLEEVYADTSPVKIFEGDVLNYDLGRYPYTSMTKNYEGSKVEIRTN